MKKLIDQSTGSSGETSPSKRDQVTSRALLKSIFDSESPELLVTQLPPQTLYLIIKQSGLSSSSDIIDIAPIEALRSCLDFDLWEKNSFNEENFWEWLSLSDEDDPLKFTQKLLRAVDLKLVAYLIVKYVHIEIFEEPTDSPPSPHFHTPDKGFTWIAVNVEDATKQFYLNRFLALLFETNTKLFYQLIGVPGVTSLSQLEEESLVDRNKRLASEGVPELDFVQEIHSPLLPYNARELIQKAERHPVVGDIAPVYPLIYDNLSSYTPLSSLLSALSANEDAQGELTLIINASIVFFNVAFHEYEPLLHHVERVKGALNLGIEYALSLGAPSPNEAYEIFGFTKLYQLGLYQLFQVRSLAQKIRDDDLKILSEDKMRFSVIAHARQPFPEIPQFLKADGSLEKSGDHLQGGTRGIGYLKEIECLKAFINSK